MYATEGCEPHVLDDSREVSMVCEVWAGNGNPACPVFACFGTFCQILGKRSQIPVFQINTDNFKSARESSDGLK